MSFDSRKLINWTIDGADFARLLEPSPTQAPVTLPHSGPATESVLSGDDCTLSGFVITPCLVKQPTAGQLQLRLDIRGRLVDVCCA